MSPPFLLLFPLYTSLSTSTRFQPRNLIFSAIKWKFRKYIWFTSLKSYFIRFSYLMIGWTSEIFQNDGIKSFWKFQPLKTIFPAYFQVNQKLYFYQQKIYGKKNYKIPEIKYCQHTWHTRLKTSIAVVFLRIVRVTSSSFNTKTCNIYISI